MAATNTKENEENLQIFLKIKPLTEACRFCNEFLYKLQSVQSKLFVLVLNFANSATQIQIDLNDKDKYQYIYANEQHNDRSGENVERRDGANAIGDDEGTLESRRKLSIIIRIF
jgi:hypothetical protein